jgi:DNA-binding NtrC family response regulator
MTILLAGTRDGAVEGVAQMLAGTGQRVRIAHSSGEVAELAAQERPLLLVVDQSIATDTPAMHTLLAAGGALIILRYDDEAVAPLPPALARWTLAELMLPTERQRLVAVVEHVLARAASAGRGHRDAPPDDQTRA